MSDEKGRKQDVVKVFSSPAGRLDQLNPRNRPDHHVIKITRGPIWEQDKGALRHVRAINGSLGSTGQNPHVESGNAVISDVETETAVSLIAQGIESSGEMSCPPGGNDDRQAISGIERAHEADPD